MITIVLLGFATFIALALIGQRIEAKKTLRVKFLQSDKSYSYLWTGEGMPQVGEWVIAHTDEGNKSVMVVGYGRNGFKGQMKKISTRTKNPVREVLGSKGETYQVTGETCTCKGFTYRRNCKHLTTV